MFLFESLSKSVNVNLNENIEIVSSRTKTDFNSVGSIGRPGFLAEIIVGYWSQRPMYVKKNYY